MDRRALLLRLWLPVGFCIVAVSALAAVPLAHGWRCYRLHANGEHARAEVDERLEAPNLLLRLASGTHEGERCVADTSAAHWEALEAGDVLDVVRVPGQEGLCELRATLENSAALLWLVGGLAGILVLGLLLLALLLQRTFTARPPPTTRLDAAPEPMPCPGCGAVMAEGYLPLVAGLHWRDRGAPVGLPHALSGLPGTVGWRGRLRLHAFRCPSCEIVTFRYGRPAAA